MRIRFGTIPSRLLGILLLVLLAASPAAANRVEGTLLGVFDGNDSEASLLLELGVQVNQLAKLELPRTSSDGLSISELTEKEAHEPIAGWWDYAGPAVVDLIVVKAGPQWAVYYYDDIITGNMPNMGLWNTSELGNKGLSHLSAYELLTPIPEPGTALLLAGGLAALALRRRTSG